MNIKETAKNVKAHIKKHKKAYIIGAVAVVGTVAAVVITKRVISVKTAKAAETVVREAVQLGDLDIPLLATKAEVNSYNRVIKEIERGRKLVDEGLSDVIPIDAHPEDWRIWVTIAGAADLWLTAHGEDILEFANTLQLTTAA
jgi:uncharacterized protein YPO0396